MLDNGELIMTSRTLGASIAYRVKASGAEGLFAQAGSWQLYTEPVELPLDNPSVQIEAKAVRYGYAESAVIGYSANEWPSLPTPRQGDVALSRVPLPERLPLPRGRANL